MMVLSFLPITKAGKAKNWFVKMLSITLISGALLKF